ncbi:MAG: acyl-CoA desaturase [Austwickia sp.]|jgi:fatty acid desaturase|nr:acyl-CoA desaturase [Austwickia sp.]MBK8436704.1 acyl-CoA desaturase [Austwickia sp.]MBK9100334.1 acyl-CoA desaturase [Austwickia sp.]
MTVIQKKPDTAYTRLSPEDIRAIGAELDAIRAEVLAARGASDAAYIRRVIKAQRALELGSRAVLMFSRHPAAWVVGTLGLAAAKTIENAELGHNILHGQWDWMRDPKIHSTTWEWDHVAPASQWKESHNQEHHNYTNVIGRDHDLGYGIMRVDEDQEWEPAFLIQPLTNLLNAVFFQWGIASYDLGFAQSRREGREPDPELPQRIREFAAKAARQVAKDYLLYPALAGPNARSTLAANVTANALRNVWTHAVIMCGHFPEDVETFETHSIEGETHDEWYLRQMLGSANISGGPLIHLLTGNLSHQIEHHLYPDLPSNRYAEIAPRVRALFDRYELHYASAPMWRQVYSAWHRIIRLSLPNELQPDQRAARKAQRRADRRARAQNRVAHRRPLVTAALHR